MLLLLKNTPDHLTFTDWKGNEVLSYQYDNFFYHPHIHPLNTLDGHCITMTLPGDHPWHNGMYFSWKYVNGYNVWDRDFYDAKWGRPVHKCIEVLYDQSANPIGFKHCIYWVNQDGENMLEESRTVIIGKIAESDAYSIDWSNETTALIDVELERKPEWGGYAGLHTRLVRAINPEISNSNGTTKITEDNPELAEWMDYRFWLDGIYSRDHFEFWGGLTVMSHPDNFRHPSPFIGYYVKNIQSVHVPVLRDEGTNLKAGETLKLDYRQMVYDGKPTRERIDGWYADFTVNSPFLSQKECCC